MNNMKTNNQLRARSHVERQAALAQHLRAVDDARHAEVGDLEQRIGAVHVRHNEAKTAAERAVQDEHNALNRALAAELGAALDEILARFGDAPRKTAEELASAWRAFNARALAELGAIPSNIHLAFACASTHQRLAYVPAFWKGSYSMGVADALSKAILNESLVPEIARLIGDLEIAVGRESNNVAYPNERLAALLRDWTTDASIKAAWNAFESATDAEWQDETKAAGAEAIAASMARDEANRAPRGWGRSG